MIISPIFNRQPPNIRSLSTGGLCNTLMIDYFPSFNRWQSREILNWSHNGRVCPQLVLICIRGCEGGSTFEWCRPDLDVVMSGGHKATIDRLLKEDILKYLNPAFK